MTKEQFILSTIRPMAEYTFPYLTSVIGVNDPNSGEQVGSGLRAVLNGRRVIITARHVIEDAMRYPHQFALSAGFGHRPYLVQGKIDSDPVGDLAIYNLPEDFPSDTPEIRFWPEERVQRSSERIATDFLFVHGFPGRRSRFFRFMNGLASRSLPYGAMQRLEPLTAALQPHEFAMEFDPTTVRGLDSESDATIDPRGLSGSPVWRIGISGRAREEWSPALSVVVGFLTQWRQEDRVLIATSAERLSEMVNRQ